MSKVIVLCPAGSVTGGPELLHQFVSELCANDVDASILYYPYGQHKTVDAYKKYDVNVVVYSDINKKNSTIVVPEVATNLLYGFNSSDKYIWWLSVDNHFKAHPKRIWGRIKFFVKTILYKKTVPIPLSKMKHYKHLSQSDYGLQFLKQHKVKNAFKLTDYLNEVHLDNIVNVNEKENIVAYNPKKGIDFTQSLIQFNPQIKFVAIERMTAIQVGELLNRSKVYIDFGEHPGKDRIPREAAMAKCVIITGLRGSAGNSTDLPINKVYKFNENPESISNIGTLINDVFDGFEDHCNKFNAYRNMIKSEKKAFSLQTKEFIKVINK